MKSVLAFFGYGLAGGIFIPLVLGVFFLAPAEFLVSTWHSLRVDTTVEGVVTRSEILEGRGGSEGSAISYVYTVEGDSFSSKRWGPGWVSNGMRGENGGALARRMTVGSTVPVYIDSSNPAFSMLIKGWPKWSLAFSLVVWGMIGIGFFRASLGSKWREVGKTASGAAVTVAFLTLVAFPETLEPRHLFYALLIVSLITLPTILFARSE